MAHVAHTGPVLVEVPVPVAVPLPVAVPPPVPVDAPPVPVDAVPLPVDAVPLIDPVVMPDELEPAWPPDPVVLPTPPWLPHDHATESSDAPRTAPHSARARWVRGRASVMKGSFRDES